MNKSHTIIFKVVDTNLMNQYYYQNYSFMKNMHNLLLLMAIGLYGPYGWNSSILIPSAYLTSSSRKEGSRTTIYKFKKSESAKGHIEQLWTYLIIVVSSYQSVSRRDTFVNVCDCNLTCSRGHSHSLVIWGYAPSWSLFHGNF